MNIDSGTIKSSPFVGVLGLVTNDFGFFPKTSLKKETKGLEDFFKIKIITGSLAQSSLIGVLAVGLNFKIAVSDLVQESEKKMMEKNGLEVFQVEKVSALGNLLALNQNGGIASELISKETVKELENFFNIKILRKNIAQNELNGSSIVSTSKGFVVNPLASEKELKLLKKTFKVEGNTATSNYGDKFVSNGVLANKNAALIGSLTSNIELGKIDEGLSG